MGGALATRPREAKEPPGVVAIRESLEAKITELAAACPEHLKPERLVQVVGILAYRTPRLQECTPASVVFSVMQAASLGLDLNPALPEGYLIPRWNKQIQGYECTFMPSYQGLAKLATNAGRLRYIQANVVRKSDKFRSWFDPEPRLEHEPKHGNENEPISHVYAMAKIPTGEVLHTVMGWEEINSIRDRSDSFRKKPNESPWTSDWAEMAKKTAIKRLVKTLPKSPDAAKAAEALAAAIELDNAEYSLEPPKPNNNTGHGQGMYAPPDQVKAYTEAMAAYLDKRNGEWLDRWAGNGQAPEGLKDLSNKWECDNHLAKWGKETGRIEIDASAAREGIKSRQIGQYTAIIYHRSKEDRKALSTELARYLDRKAEDQEQVIRAKNPHLFDEAPEEPEGGPEDESHEAAEDPAEASQEPELDDDLAGTWADQDWQPGRE